MAPRHLLVCFDAFGTLFTPKQPVMQQYADVARSFGLGGFTNEQVGAAFGKAYKQESASNPNFGHATGLGAQKWWTNVINSTFKQVVPAGQKIPDELVPKLLHRFWSDEGYDLYNDVPTVLRRLREHAKLRKQEITVGVITNSDDRVPEILESLGLRVAPVRFGQPVPSSPSEADIDFAVMSYDVGHEKPDRRIFDAAVQVLDTLLAARQTDTDSKSWTKLYIGDEYAKDVVGSLAAGWKAVLVDRDGTHKQPDLLEPKAGEETLFEAFEKARALSFANLKSLADSIPL